MYEQIKEDVERIGSELIQWRRDFHRHPELSNEEYRTSQVVRSFMEDLGMPVRQVAGTGLIGVLEGKSGGKTVALRADMDALPLMEIGSKEYISQNPGICHACGHDGHTAILMGVAKVLTQCRQNVTGRVVFLFQPSEEKFPGGAKRMIEEGALEGVDAIFGLHLWQSLPTGKVVSLREPMMAAPDRFEIKISGRGGHGSAPHLTVDPILVAAHVVINLQSIVSRNVDPQQAAVLTVSTISSGSAFNIIPGEAVLTGTVRTFDPAIQGLMERRIREIASGTSATFQASSQVNYVRGHPAVINDPAMVEIVHQAARASLGEDSFVNMPPVMGGEDFAFYLEKIPGAFMLFGMGDGTSYPHHHPGFDMDEKSLPQATLLMATLAMRYLSS